MTEKKKYMKYIFIKVIIQLPTSTVNIKIVNLLNDLTESLLYLGILIKIDGNM